MVFAAAPLRLDATNIDRNPERFGLLASWSALLALGRALTRGQLRRLCWAYPPSAGRQRIPGTLPAVPASLERAEPARTQARQQPGEGSNAMP
jgi:hypothetical protein